MYKTPIHKSSHICSSINMTLHDENALTNLSSFVLDNVFSSCCNGKSQPKNTHISKFQHETILADLNWYTAKTPTILDSFLLA